MSRQPIWLASYPRSGNTLLRTVLYHCFGLVSGSIYLNDLGGNKELESFIGHIEQEANGKINFGDDTLPLIKTHETSHYEGAAVYVVREGTAACVSLWEWIGRSLPLEDIISGNHRFGTWANHVSAWEPWDRPNTLLVKYEEILSDLPLALRKLSQFLDAEIVNREIPPRETIADVDGRWVRKSSQWREKMTDDQLELFRQINGQIMKKIGYD